jgi:ubiquinone/menaquinone biosynthesis C-methylase UbiE
MNSNPRQKDFFNERAEVWDEITTHDLRKVQYIIELQGIQSNDKILDVGTGTGILIPFYEKYLVEGSVVAIDYSDNMITIARSKYPEEDHPMISFFVSDLYDLKYQEEFDMVMCYSCFPHFVDKPLALQILSKALKKGGRLVIAHSDSSDKINNIHMDTGAEVKNDFLPGMEQLKQMMKENGLAVTFARDDEKYFICIARRLND